MNRSDFYYRQIVTESELDQAFQDVADLAAQLVTDHTVGNSAVWGVLNGLEVTEQAVPDLTVQVADGVAVDESGLRIPVTGGPASVDFSAEIAACPPGEAFYCRIYAEHDTDLQDPRLDGNNDPVDYRVLDSFVISKQIGAYSGATPVRPTILADKVLLATLYLYASQTSILDSDISMALPYYSTALPPAGVVITERQEGGVVPHGRLIPTARPLLFEADPFTPQIVVNTNRNSIQLEGGNLHLDGQGDDGGGSVFMEQGPIYKASEVRVGGNIQDGGGYWYGDPAGDEYAEPLQALNKYLSYHPTAFQPAPGTAQAYPNDTATVDNKWTYKVFGSGSSFSCYWNVTVNFTTAGQRRVMFCPLVGLPFRAQLVECQFFVTVDTVNADLEFAVSVWRHTQDTGTTPVCLNVSGAPTFEDLASTGHFVFDTNGLTAHIIRPDWYVYFAKFDVQAKGATVGPAGIRLTGCRVKYEIREASGEYYHPTL